MKVKLADAVELSECLRKVFCAYIGDLILTGGGVGVNQLDNGRYVSYFR